MTYFVHFFTEEMRPILVLDFGSQFAHLIGNRVRRLSVYSEILPFNTPAEEIAQRNPSGIILSGGPPICFEKRLSPTG